MSVTIWLQVMHLMKEELLIYIVENTQNLPFLELGTEQRRYLGTEQRRYYRTKISLKDRIN